MARKKVKPQPVPSSPWDDAKSINLMRNSGSQPSHALVPAVKFFVLMLEQLDCPPHYSSDDESANGFCVAFHGPRNIVEQIESLGILSVDVVGPGYRLTLVDAELRNLREGKPWTEDDRDTALRAAAYEWVNEFGPLDQLKPATIKLPPNVLSALRALLRHVDDNSEKSSTITTAIALLREVAFS